MIQYITSLSGTFLFKFCLQLKNQWEDLTYTFFFFVERCSRLLCIEHTLTHTITQFYIDELSVIVLIFACVVNL